MKQKNLLTRTLLLFALIVGSTSVWAADPEVTLDFTSQDNWNIPTSGTNTTLTSFTDGTYTIKLYATTNYKLNSGYLILGKENSYLELPAFDFDVEKIEVVGSSSASESVKQNIYVGETVVSTETKGAKNVTNTYEIASTYQAAGNIYKIVVTSAHNTQISFIKIYKKVTSSDPSSNFAFKNKTASISFPTTTTYTGAYTTADGYAGSISFELSDNTCGATIDQSTGQVTVANEGKVTVKGIAAPVSGYFSSSFDTYTLTVTDPRDDAELKYSVTEKKITVDETLSAPELTNPNNITEIIFTSDNENVATVDANGNVTGVSAGTTTITASFAGNSSYKPGSASYTVTVKQFIPADAILYESFDTNEKVGGNDGTWSAIQQTPAPSFDNEGWTFETAYAGYRCVRTGKSGSITTPALGITGDVTLSFMMASWGTDTNDGYVTILNGGTFDDGESTQKISIEKSEWGTFTLELKNVTAETKIKFFDNGKGKRLFIDEVLIVKPSVKIAVAKDYISFCSDKALDFTNVEGLEALVVTKVNDTSVSTEKVTTVPAGVGVILHKDPKGEATSFNVPVAATATAPAAKYLVGVLEDTEIGGNGTDYVLKDGKFVLANAGTLAAGKAYLKTDANAAPALTIGFGDEGTTGIRSIDNGQLTIDNVYYDLSGRRVAEPTKGVYIVNGKKVVIK